MDEEDLYESSPCLSIVVTTLMGTEFTMDNLYPTDTVKTLKMAIQDMQGLRYSTQNLMYRRQKLDDDEKELHEYGIVDDAKLTLVTTMRGGPLNARRAASASSVEPDSEVVLEIYDGNDVVGSIMLDEDILDMFPSAGADGKQFFVYLPDDIQLDMLQRGGIGYMEVDEFYGAMMADSAADSPLFADAEVDNPPCSPMCSSRSRARSYSALRLTQQEEHEDMEMKVERLRANMMHVKQLKQLQHASAFKRRETTAGAALDDGTTTGSGGRDYAGSAFYSDAGVSPLSLRGITADLQTTRDEALTRAQGPTPLHAAYGSSATAHDVLYDLPGQQRSTVVESNTRATPATATASRRNAAASSPPSQMPLTLSSLASSGGRAAEERPSPTSVCHLYDRQRSSDHDYWRGSTVNKTAVSKRLEAKPPTTTTGFERPKTKSHCHSSHPQCLRQAKKPSKGAMIAEASERERLEQATGTREGRLPRSALAPSSACRRTSHSKLYRDEASPPQQLLPSETTWHAFPSTPRTAPHKQRALFPPGPANQRQSEQRREATSEASPLCLPPIHPTRAGQCNTSNPSISVPKAPAGAPVAAKTKDSRPPRQRCSQCGKKLSLAGTFTCRCGVLLCTKHRNPESHPCTYDYKTEGRRELKQANPRVQAIKLPKI